MIWAMSHRADVFSREIADRHYNRQKVGSPQFAPPGRCLVLKSQHDPIGGAFWITSWPYARFVKHRWAGAMVCSAFRNEGGGKASEMIVQAVQATVAYYGEPPIQGLVTFLDRDKVAPIKRRGVLKWGYTWEQAGFEDVGETEGGLMAFKLFPCNFPDAEPPINFDHRHQHYRTAASLKLELDLVCGL